MVKENLQIQDYKKSVLPLEGLVERRRGQAQFDGLPEPVFRKWGGGNSSVTTLKQIKYDQSIYPSFLSIKVLPLIKT